MTRLQVARLPAPVVMAVAVLASSLPAATARANGRFPRAERLVEDPSNPNRLLLAATYGLLTTHDRGKSWYQTCEAAFAAGLAAYNGDPLLELAADGSALVNIQTAIQRSTDDCSWAEALGTPLLAGYELIEDFAVDKAHRQIVVALVGTFVGASRAFVVKESIDGGNVWTVIGAPLPLGVAYTSTSIPGIRRTFTEAASRPTELPSS